MKAVFCFRKDVKLKQLAGWNFGANVTFLGKLGEFYTWGWGGCEKTTNEILELISIRENRTPKLIALLPASKRFMVMVN